MFIIYGSNEALGGNILHRHQYVKLVSSHYRDLFFRETTFEP